jgi:thioredoxin reductase/NAD-dependent dihydropyrimidine dehydrogenase PreA subunit
VERNEVKDPTLLVYAVVLLVAFVPYAWRRRRRDRHGRAVLRESLAAGIEEPASLHPVIDEARCLGCTACVTACPEHDVLGIVAGKARLVDPSGCIGHGACKEACPFDAIRLVLGSESRGVEIPLLTPDFQTNVPGVYVAGELGGMGLICNAIQQGRQAVESIRRRPRGAAGDVLDVLVVGAGPAGFAASLAAMEAGLSYRTLEQETLGGTVAHYPRGKIVMTAPVDLPLYGKVRLKETSKESLLELWRSVERKTGVRIGYGERVEAVRCADGTFEVTSTRAAYRARSLVLAIGRRGTPRKLGVPGEESTKVVYRLVEAEQYRGQKVLVVGGGDSALEAADALAAQPDTEVALSYRQAGFSRAKPKNRARVEDAVRGGGLRLMLESTVRRIEAQHVELETRQGAERLPNDAVIVCAGGLLPTPFLQSIGIEMETLHGEEWPLASPARRS